MSNKKVSCIIPAYNEARTVAGMVRTCLKSPDIAEVIAVNDGSQDKTLEKLRTFGEKIKIVNLPKNRGKGYAITQGVKIASHPYLLFLDADLMNYENHHIFTLIYPVISNKADMTIGIPVNLKGSTFLLWRFSGQRCLKKKDILPLISQIEKTNYGLEVILNEAYKDKKIVVLPTIFNKKDRLFKMEKEPDWAASFAKEVWEIFLKTMSVKTASYRERAKTEFLKNLASYLRISYQKAKKYLVEEN
ncbi:glycosyltransferase family 2 protein [Candidatus Shapirobacteria bacterium]|nr:glycosyltransferase family 2 protein [Candidatus Shapirobacteria bacterium]